MDTLSTQEISPEKALKIAMKKEKSIERALARKERAKAKRLITPYKRPTAEKSHQYYLTWRAKNYEHAKELNRASHKRAKEKKIATALLELSKSTEVDLI